VNNCKTEQALKQLADVVGATEGLRYVDFAAGEDVMVPDEIRSHTLWNSMRKTIQERDSALALVVELAKALDGMIEPSEDVASELAGMSAGCECYLARLEYALDDAKDALSKVDKNLM